MAQMQGALINANTNHANFNINDKIKKVNPSGSFPFTILSLSYSFYMCVGFFFLNFLHFLNLSQPVINEIGHMDMTIILTTHDHKSAVAGGLRSPYY